MGLEMKTPENSENSLRNRKKKENVQEKSEQSLKNSSKSSEKMETEEVEKVEQENEILNIKKKIESKSLHDLKAENAEDNSNFKIRFELDPMSIALFTIAIVTRFFKLSEPRNVV